MHISCFYPPVYDMLYFFEALCKLFIRNLTSATVCLTCRTKTYSLVYPDQMRRGKNTYTEASDSKHFFNKADCRTFSICSGNMNSLALFMGISQFLQHPEQIFISGFVSAICRYPELRNIVNVIYNFFIIHYLLSTFSGYISCWESLSNATFSHTVPSFP